MVHFMKSQQRRDSLSLKEDYRKMKNLPVVQGLSLRTRMESTKYGLGGSR